MFYYTTEGWKAYKHKISYPTVITDYNDDLAPYEGLEGVEVVNLTLTDEQLRRLETIKLVGEMSETAVEEYVFNGNVEDDQLIVLKTEVKAEEQRQKLAKFIDWTKITTEDMLGLVGDFKSYQIGSFYLKDDIFTLDNQLYRVLQTHTSQEDWKPESTPALYIPIAPPEVIAEWVQPFGGSGTYILGAKVLYKGQVYENIYTGDTYNVWSPEGYPQGWKLVP